MDTVLLDPPLVALDKDAPVPYAGKEEVAAPGEGMVCGSSTSVKVFVGHIMWWKCRLLLLPHTLWPSVARTCRAQAVFPLRNRQAGRQAGLLIPFRGPPEKLTLWDSRHLDLNRKPYWRRDTQLRPMSPHFLFKGGLWKRLQEKRPVKVNCDLCFGQHCQQYIHILSSCAF